MQKMLIAVHLSRKSLETALIASALEICRPIILPPPVPEAILPPSWMSFTASFPLYCVAAGGQLAYVPGLADAFAVARFPTKGALSKQATDALLWYWKQLRWPASPSPLNRGASWTELTLDFMAATGIRIIGPRHNLRTQLQTSAEAFSRFAGKLRAITGVPLHPGTDKKVSSLSPLMVLNETAGVSIAPSFLRQQTWAPFLGNQVGLALDFGPHMRAIKLAKVPCSKSLLYTPIQDAFSKAFPRPA